MDSVNNNEKSPKHERKAKRLSNITSMLNCAMGRPSYEDRENSYTKSPEPKTRTKNGDCKENVGNGDGNDKCRFNFGLTKAQNGGTKVYPKLNGVHNGVASKSLDEDENVLLHERFVETILSTPFEDTFVPSHQSGPDFVIPSLNQWTARHDGAVRLQLKESGPPSMAPLTMMTQLRQTALHEATARAMSVQRNGRWIHWTFAEYLKQAETVAKAFIKLGLERFHSVAILGFNAPEWHISNFAAHFAGGVSLGIYLTNSASTCEYILRDSEANVVVVDDDVQLGKILEVRKRLPHLKAVVRYLGESVVPDVLSWQDLLRIGNSVPDEVLEKRVRSVAINQCCTLIYTSGTTGDPKGVMLTHDNLYFTSKLIADYWVEKEVSNIVSYLPLSHIAGQISDIYTTLHRRVHIYFAQPDALKQGLVDTLKDVTPTAFFGVPRVYEKINEKIMESVNEMSFVKRNLITWALRNGHSYTKSCLEGRPIVPYGYSISDRLIQKIRQAVGLNASNIFLCGGAQLSRDVQEFFLSLNMVALECYGMSECSGPHMVNTLSNYCLGSVGKNSDYTETCLKQCNLEGHGEICLRGRNVFMGYLNDEQKTRDAFDDDGWLHSGDVGCYNADGFLFVTGRIKEILITAGGENVAPAPIENRVKSTLPIVNHAVLIGDKRKFLSMLLTLNTEINMNTLIPTDELSSKSCKWCRTVGSEAKSVQDILESPDVKVMQAIQEGIDRVNGQAISNAQRIQKWIILPHSFSLDGGEIGPSLKLKRSYIVKKYESVIEEFYKC